MRPRAWIALCVALAALPYLEGLRNGFAWLDQREILDGMLIVRGPREALSLFLDDRNFPGYFRPLYNLSFSLDLWLWGRDARGFHATSLALHLVSVALVASIALRAGWSGPWAAALAGLWGLHPVNSETAGLIHCRADVLCTALLLGALACALPRADGARPGRGREVGALALFALALYTKELAYLLPPLLAAWWYAARGTPRAPSGRFVIAALALAALAAVHRAVATSASAYVSELGLGERLATFGAVLLGYLRKLLVPWHLSLSDATWRFSALGGARASVLLTLGLLAVVAAWTWRRRADLRPWLALFALTLLPVAQLVPILHVQAERYLYLPSLAFVGLVLQAVRGPMRARAAARAVWPVAALCIAVAGAFAWRTRARVATFADDATLFAREVELDPRYREGLSYLAIARDRAGRLAEAELYYRAALARDPALLAYVDHGGTAVNLSSNLLAQHRPEAVQAVHDAFAPQVVRPHQRRELDYNLAVADFRLERFEQALPVFVDYLEHESASPGALYLAGVSALRLGRQAEARARLTRYLELYPTAPDAAQVRALVAGLE